MKNPFSWLFRQVFGMKNGPAVQAEVNQVVAPLAIQALTRAGLPVTADGAKQALAQYAARKLHLSDFEFALLRNLAG